MTSIKKTKKIKPDNDLSSIKNKNLPEAKKMSNPVSVSKEKVKPKEERMKYSSEREEINQKIRLNLLKQRETLLSEAETALDELPGQATFPDLGDQASAETDRDVMLRLRGREQRLLKKIDEALERMENRSFGICDECGNEIDLKRLEARPVTTFCIECKILQEEEEKRRSS